MSPLEIVAVIFSVLAVTLTVKRHILCWLFNFIAAAVYGYVFYSYQLYAETFLQSFFMLMSVYGFLTWQKTAADSHVNVQHMVLKVAFVQIALTAILGFSFGLCLHYFTQASLPLLDAQLVAFSLLATYWASRKYLATWGLWIILDVIYVGMFIYKELFLTAVLYAGFVGLAFWGFRQWQHSSLKSAKN